MLESRWIHRSVAGVVSLAAVVAIGATALAAGPRPWSPPPCAGPPNAPALAERGAATAWFRHEPVLVDGTLTRSEVVLGSAAQRRPARLVLDAESFVAGPFGDVLLVGTDDGRSSRLSLVDVAAGCAWPLATSDDVIRRATLGPDGRTVFEMRVDRATRADLGIWRRWLDGPGAVERVLGPIAPDGRFGRTFTTGFTWSQDGRGLAVRSCGELACRVRVLEPATGRHRSVADPSLGDVVGLDADRIVAHAACRGLPCPLVSVSLVDGTRIVLEPVAGLATMTTLADGTSRVVFERGAARLRAMGPDGSAAQDLADLRDGHRLVPADDRSGSGAAVPPGWIALAHGGRIAPDRARATVIRHIPDGRTVELGEVSR
jgi:hypothetical protein